MKENAQAQIKVFLVDDHAVVREGLRAYLSGIGAIKVVGDAANDQQALLGAKKLAPDVIVVDVSMPGLGGAELARRLLRAAPRAKLVAFSMHSSEEYVVRMARCGVHGYAMKDKPTSLLVEAIVRVSRGELSFPAGMTEAVQVAGAALAPRERALLALLAGGLALTQLARKLSISVKAMETCRERLSLKLSIPTAAGLARYAVQHAPALL